MAGLVGRRRDAGQQEVDQRLQVGAPGLRVQRGDAVAGDAVDDREVDLLRGRIEVQEQLVDLVDDLPDARVGAVDLVDDEDDRQLALERLAEHEAGLRQRSLARVDQEQRPVDHRQAALDLAAEVGVTGRVDDVHLHIADADGGVLGEDRDPLLALQVVGVHHPLRQLDAGVELPRLPQQRVDERRLAVIAVGDDGDVADVLADGARADLRGREGGRRFDGGLRVGCGSNVPRHRQRACIQLNTRCARGVAGIPAEASRLRRDPSDRRRALLTALNLPARAMPGLSTRARADAECGPPTRW